MNIGKEAVWAQTHLLTCQGMALEALLIAKGVLKPGELSQATTILLTQAPKAKKRRLDAVRLGIKKLMGGSD